jgi:hypothetical protein
MQIPFNTRLEDVLDWLPGGYLASSEEVVMPVHLVLHRFVPLLDFLSLLSPTTYPSIHSATGRTLPHCYLEMVSVTMAQHLIDTMDRSQLGDRTVRVKWERPGELMRDVRLPYFFLSPPLDSRCSSSESR